MAQGISVDQIKQNLLASGWQEAQINEGLVAALQNKPPTPLEPSATATPGVIQKSSVNSGFSVLLAFVLFVSLLVLLEKIISDVTKLFDASITGKLIVNTFVAIPFLLLSFVLHVSLRHQQKFQILSRIYVIVSAWLVIQLLFNVSQYILDKNNTYGVYVVLIIIVLALTGTIIGAQKFFKK